MPKRLEAHLRRSIRVQIRVRRDELRAIEAVARVQRVGRADLIRALLAQGVARITAAATPPENTNAGPQQARHPDIPISDVGRRRVTV